METPEKARCGAVRRYVGALFDAAGEGSLVEVRYRAGEEMRRRFFAAGRPDPVVDVALSLASRADVFIGVLPRLRRRGHREDIAREGRVLWADCDTASSAAALDSFYPAPAIVVASGSGCHRHAYWLLSRPLGLDAIERLNRRPALALDADAGAVTRATAILRPPGTVNMKHSPPSPVRLVSLLADRRVDAAELERRLPPEPAPSGSSGPLRPPGPRAAEDRSLARHRAGGLLRAADRPAGRPLAQAPLPLPRRPHAEPARLRGRGAGLVLLRLRARWLDLRPRALLWGRRTDGRDFVELRRELRRRFG